MDMPTALNTISARISAITHPATYLDAGLTSSDAVPSAVGGLFLAFRLSKSLVVFPGCVELGVDCLYDETYPGGSVVGTLVGRGFFTAVLLTYTDPRAVVGLTGELTALILVALLAPLCVEDLYVVDVGLMSARLVVTIWVACISLYVPLLFLVCPMPAS